jgi:NAD(P)-dependent dehydrogenase (short-subunit alcohol dehydrogenase family)
MSTPASPGPRTWFITGCSSGFGRAIAEAALQAGDRVVLTARDVSRIEALATVAPEQALAVALDVTKEDQIQAALEAAIARFGPLDVVVNNAGYGLIGAIEECQPDQIRRCVETNLFGTLNVIRAVLPHLRTQRSGHIVNVSAAAAISNYAGFGVYGAAKAGVEALSESLRAETAHLGLRVTLVEPGPFRTDFIGRSLDPVPQRLPDYDRTSGKFAQFLKVIDGKQPGDPARAAQAIVAMVHAGDPPFRMPLGRYVVKKLRDRAAEMTRLADEQESTAIAADFPTGG